MTETATITLRSHPASVRLARRFVWSWLGQRGTTRIGEDLQLVASELVTNAVRHSVLSAVHISRRGDAIRLEVDDQGGGKPRLLPLADPTAASGRGLRIVERLASSWGVDRLPTGGKRVWCELKVPRVLGRRPHEPRMAEPPAHDPSPSRS
ncbi:MAG: ATP-binding protein [Acidimicrobiales bacterium]